MPSDGELPHALAAAMPTNVLDEHLFIAADHLSICTMHLAKGLNSAPSPSWRAPTLSSLPRPIESAAAPASEFLGDPGDPARTRAGAT